MLKKINETYTDDVHNGVVTVTGEVGFIGLMCSVIQCNPVNGALSLALLCCANKMAGRSADDVKVKVMTTADTVAQTCHNWAHQLKAAMPAQMAPPPYVADNSKKMQ